MKRTLSAWALALALTIPAALPASAAAFSDVAADAWYAQAVEEVTAAGLMNGVSADAFAPDAEVTRGMVVAVLWRLAGSPQAETAASFPDVTAGDYYAEAVAWAQSAGIAAGRADGTFGGSAPVTREELAVFLCRYSQHMGQQTAEGVLDQYADAGDIQSWALEGMAHAVGAGLITGLEGNILDPGGTATRAQLAVILQRLLIPAVG